MNTLRSDSGNRWAEQDASVVADPQGLPYMGAGMSACARDLARFGEMLRNDGFYNGRQILPASWVHDTRLGMIVCVNYSLTVTIAACYPMATTAIKCGQTAYPMNSCASVFTAKSFTSTAPSNWSASNCHPTRTRQTSRSMVQPTGPYAPLLRSSE